MTRAGRDQFGSVYHPVIYAIYNVTEEKYYIGKTKQAVTKRWFAHLYQFAGVGEKFRIAIATHPITSWHFRVLEEVEIPACLTDQKHVDYYMALKENEWMDTFNSIENGYNDKMTFNPFGFRNYDEFVTNYD